MFTSRTVLPFHRATCGSGSCGAAVTPSSLQRRALAAWPAKWKQKAPRIKEHKRKSKAQLTVQELKEAAQRRERKRHEKVKRKYGRAPFGMADAPGSPSAVTPVAKTETVVPPALLLPTGSPYAYISKMTAESSQMDPRTLFPPAEMQRLPPLFRQGSFAYDGVETLSPQGSPHQPTNSKNGKGIRNDNIPQVAFLGRSNVGKSSLVNALMRRDLARCSKQPGRTQQVHRFVLQPHEKENDKQQQKQPQTTPYGLFLDLPGYGFAVAPDAVLDEWQRKTQRILQREIAGQTLRRIYVLIDARTGVTQVDQTVLQWLQDGHMPHSLVWTKADAVSKPQLVKGVNFGFLWYQQQLFLAEQQQQEQGNDGDDEADAVCYMGPIIHVTSTKGAGQGLTELLSAIEAEFLVDDDE